MLKVNDDHIRTLSEAILGPEKGTDVDAFVASDCESPDFYRGVITGLVLCYRLLMRELTEEQKIARNIAFLAARTALHSFLCL